MTLLRSEREPFQSVFTLKVIPHFFGGVMFMWDAKTTQVPKPSYFLSEDVFGSFRRRTEKGKKGGESSGTGFFVSNDGHIVTNNHVIEGCKAIDVTPVGSRATSAYVVSRDKTNDLAIIKTTMPPTVLPAIRSQPRLGESVYVFGFPLTGLLSTSGNFTTGTITAVSGLGDDTRFLQISAPVQPGNSGGPLIDKFGNVIGVIVSKLDALNVAAVTKDIPQNVNFAIKSNIALNFLEFNSLAANTSAKSRELPAEAIAELAKLFTVRITCH